MDGFLKAFLLIVTFAVMANVGAAAQINNSMNSMFNGTPSYTLFTDANALSFDKCYIPISYVWQRGLPNLQLHCHPSNASIGISISGAGDVAANKFVVNIPKNIVAKETINFTDCEDNPIHSNKNNTESIWNLSSVIFNIDPNKSRYLINKGEATCNGRRYLNFNFSVSDIVSPGDYEISLILFYKNGTEWHQADKMISVHIKNWYEQGSYQLLVLVIAILSLFVSSEFINGIEFVSKWISKKQWLKRLIVISVIVIVLFILIAGFIEGNF